MLKLTKEVKVALLVLMAATMAIVGLSYLKGRSLLNTTNTYYVEYANTQGLNRGDRVVLSGVQVGVVQKQELIGEHKDKVRVSFDLDNNIEVPKDSYVILATSDLFGSRVLELRLGRNPTLAEDGSTLQDSVSTGLLEKVEGKMDPTLQRINKLTDNLVDITGQLKKIMNREDEQANKTIGHVENTMANLSLLTAELRGTVTRINQLSETANRLMSDPNLAGTLKNTRQSTDSLAATMAEIKRLTQRTQTLMGELNTLTGNLNSGQGTMGMLMKDPKLYQNLNETTSSLNKLLEDLRQNPKRYVHFSVFGRKAKPVTE